MTGALKAMWRHSIDDPESFWGAAAQAIDWTRAPTTVLDRSNAPFYAWFPDGELNSCFNAVDRHVSAGYGDQLALIHDSPVTGRVTKITYAGLLDRVARLAGAMATLGVTKGDRVIIYMPMVPEAVIAMLAVARLGAVHGVVFGGFAAHELAVRIDDATPKLILSASCGIEGARVIAYKPLLDAAIALAAHKPDHTLILQRDQEIADLQAPRDLDWAATVRDAPPHDCVPVRATDPLYILYTSGTTGQPKGIVRDNGGHAVALMWSMKHIYGVEPGAVFWAASDVGWVVGHSYITYGPLFNRNTTVMFEGKPVGTPDAGAFWRVIADHGVNTLFTAPTALRAIRREDEQGAFLKTQDTSSLKTLFLAGERSDPATLAWCEDQLGVPVIDHWWQTETGWAISGVPLGVDAFPVRHGAAGKALPGSDLKVLDDEGHEVAAGTLGNLALKLPLPPGAFQTLWQADERCVATYFSEFPGYYTTADAGLIDDEDFVFVMARTDDVINVAGHRLSTGAMEEVIAAHDDIAECAVLGIHDAVKGQVPLGLLVLKAGREREESALVAEIVADIRRVIGPVAAFRQAVVVKRLPKTRSGKILRGTVRKIADGDPWTLPPTIDDPATLDDIEAVLTRAGIGAGTSGRD